MFVIEREGHMGFYWDGERKIFLEKETVIFPSRSSCLEYLEKIHGREKAVDLIVTMKENKGKLYSF
jgi:hypothetical protein